MNKSTQMKIRVLKKARAQIRSRKESFVCFALDNVMLDARNNFSTKDSREVFAAARELKNEIHRIFESDGLSIYSSVGQWLVHKGVLSHYEYDMTSVSAMRRYRVAWLTSWINDLEKGAQNV